MSIGQALLLGQLARYFSLPCDRRDYTETRNVYLRGAGMKISSKYSLKFKLKKQNEAPSHSKASENL